MKLAKAEDIIIRLDAASAKRLHNYESQLSADRDKRLFDIKMYNYLRSTVNNVKHLEDTKNYLDGIGFSQSKYEYSKIKDQLDNFCKPGAPNKAWNKYFQLAEADLTAEVSRARLKTLTPHFKEDVYDLVPKKDTHAGFSYILTGQRRKGEYFENLFTKFKSHVQEAKREGSFNKPILIGTRTQASGAFNDDGSRTNTFKAKSRLVSMVDIYQVMAETIYAKPLQEWLGYRDWYAGGKDDQQINGIITKYVARGRYATTIDYSNYDQSIPSWLIHKAFNIIKSAFQCGHFDNELFEIVKMDFICKVFIDGEGRLVYADKGVPSGSMFTQIVDSIINRLMIKTYMYSRGITCDHMIIMGDDNLIFTEEKLDLEDLSNYLNSMFGIVVHPEKCKQVERFQDPEFLSRYWTLQGCDRCIEVLYSKLLYPERYRDYSRSDVSNMEEMIVHAYCLTYPVAMMKVIDDKTFIYPESRGAVLRTEFSKAAKYLSGLMKYRMEYLR